MSRQRLKARADRVREEADLGEMLGEWGYSVVSDRHREQQFSCDLHGIDNKPSARYYGRTNSTYCWVCQKSRDAISYMMEKEGLSFRRAIEALEAKLGLESLPWDDEEDVPHRPEDEIDEVLATPSRGYEHSRDRTLKLLDTLTVERDLPQKKMLAFWNVFDRVEYGVARQNWSEEKGATAMETLRTRVMDSLREMA